MIKTAFFLLVTMFLFPLSTDAQRILGQKNEDLGADNSGSKGFGIGAKNGSDDEKEEDKTKIGLRTWTANRFNDMDSVAVDSFSHHFQNENFTEGKTGRYNTLGNMGSPRMSRIFTDRPERFGYFIFSQPYDFFLRPFESFHFTNTLSPITNITYHETTSSDNGEDHIRAKYAVNIDKTTGIGFNLDYLYGRGYYENQATSQFGAVLYGSMVKDKYKAHLRLYSNYLKTTENGGITDDDYISNPEKFPSSFTTKDIPTNLNKVWNKLYLNGGQLTHSYSIGYYRDKKQDKQAAEDSIKLIILGKKKNDTPTPGDSLTLDSISPSKQPSLLSDAAKGTDDSTLLANRIFVPVTNFIHTLEVGSNQRSFISNKDNSTFFYDKYMEGDSTLDKTTHIQVSNMFAIELCEGFNKWAQAGLRIFAQHDYNHYSIPLTPVSFSTFNENRITLGGMLVRRKGKHINYKLSGQTSSDGENWGEFELHGSGDLYLPLFKDTFMLNVCGSVINQRPTFFYRHYQSAFLWWDNDNLSNQFSSRIGATLYNSKTKTKLAVNLENIKKYTYFSSDYTQVTKNNNTYNAMSSAVKQASDNIQLFSATLNQDFRLGILNWENEITYQKVSNSDILPLPSVSLYTNLYLLFRIAKVLRVEFGGDMRYFTEYYAPTYNPALGMYTNQPETNRIKIGNHPVIDVYANCHLKHTRFYIMYHHVNYSSNGGNSFLAPHYPINPGMLKLGLSWNFFN